VDIPLNSPGLYTVTEIGAGIERRASVAVSVAVPAGGSSSSQRTAPIDLTGVRAAAAPEGGGLQAPWLLGAAIVVLVIEWAYWRRRTRRVEAVTG
jgi:hypothetical protein